MERRTTVRLVMAVCRQCPRDEVKRKAKIIMHPVREGENSGGREGGKKKVIESGHFVLVAVSSLLIVTMNPAITAALSRGTREFI